MPEAAPDLVMRIAIGFMAAKHLFVANEIGLFNGLAQGPVTLDELAAICGIPRRTAGISADAMVRLGLGGGRLTRDEENRALRPFEKFCRHLTKEQLVARPWAYTHHQQIWVLRTAPLTATP